MGVFMSFITQVTKGNLRRQGLPVPEEDEAPEHRPNTPHVRFNGEDLWEVLTNNKAANHYKARGFFINLAINHAVLMERGAEDDGMSIPTYSASSPDEEALVYAASHFGFVFEERVLREVTLRMPEGILETYEILYNFEFTSARKRSSVVCQHPDGKTLLLLTKGADMEIYRRLEETPGVAAEKERAQELINLYCDEGLRTLVIAQR